MELRHITTLAELRAEKANWDDLWRRSEVAIPTGKAEPTAQWLEAFAPRAPLDVFVVEHQGAWVAALPLYRRRIARVVPVLDLIGNSWSPCGGLLLDPRCDVPRVTEALLRGLRGVEETLLWLEGVPPRSEERRVGKECRL